MLLPSTVWFVSVSSGGVRIKVTMMDPGTTLTIRMRRGDTPSAAREWQQGTPSSSPVVSGDGAA
jgi:hypothetical protein